jgi:phospholipid/cholesterol/gamma-HCH transport system substrate-binding protein
MIKTAPTFARIAIMAIFAFGSFAGGLYLWLAFGGSSPLGTKGYRIHVLVPEATQLADQSDVRISGVSVGKVVKLAGGPNDRSDVTIQLRSRYAPLAKDSRAMLRTKTLLGETYVELTPGHPAKGTVPEDGTLPPAQVEPTVEIDEIMSTFDPATRKRFEVWMQSQAEAIGGRGADINAAFGQLPGFTEHFDDLLRTLDAQGRAVTKSISSTADVFDAISQREGELRGLITDSNRLFAVTARRNQDLAGIFRALPSFERESTATLPVLTRLAKDGDPVVKQLQPAATELGPTFAALHDVSPEFRGLFTKLDDVVSASQKGLPAFNDILARFPALLDAFQPFLRNANPMVQYIGNNNREISAFFGNVVSATSPRDSVDVLKNAKDSVHYLRTSQLLSPEALAYQARPLGSSRENAYQQPGAFDQLQSGLPVLTTAPCSNPDAEQPTSALPTELEQYISPLVYRTAGSDVLRPACRAQGTFPGFPTIFPQLRAEQP